MIAAKPNALCVTFDRFFDQNLPQLCTCLEEIRKKLHTSFAVCVDVSRQVQASISEETRQQTLKPGDLVTLIRAGSNATGEIKISTNEWDTLFRKDATVHIGFHSIILCVKDFGHDTVKAEVIQGGTLYANTQISIPATRREPSLSDLEKINPKYLEVIDIDYVILPCFVRKKEIDLIEKQVARFVRKQPWLLSKIDTKVAMKTSQRFSARLTVLSSLAVILHLA